MVERGEADRLSGKRGVVRLGRAGGGIVLAALVDVPLGSGSGAEAYAAVALAGL